MLSGRISAETPNTSPIFAMFEPTIAPSPVSVDTVTAPRSETNSSGAVVANATTVTPTVDAFSPTASARVAGAFDEQFGAGVQEGGATGEQ